MAQSLGLRPMVIAEPADSVSNARPVRFVPPAAPGGAWRFEFARPG